MEQREENVNYYQQRFRQQQQQQQHHPVVNNHAQLRKVLNVMFPPSYIKLNHRPPNTVCSLLNTTCWPRISCNSNHDYYGDSREQLSDSDSGIEQELASTEPTSRKSVIALRDHLNSSLVQHQAKPVGLCAIRRAIYDQCFDELIRQVTVGCIEQGLLLFRIRNELRSTMNSYRVAYEAGVGFGLNKAIEAELKLEENRVKICQLEAVRNKSNMDSHLRIRSSELELRNKLESVDKMKEYYKGEIAKRDLIIEQQRAIIKALSQKFTSEIKSPI